MGFIKKIFGGSNTPKKEKILPWISLKEISELDTILKKSKVKTQIIFKHSTRCGISKMVLNQFVDAYSLNENDLDLYYLDLLSFREVSNEVEIMFQVIHQSPQLIVLRNKTVVAHASHGAINQIVLQDYI